jgi:hypothetical protein
MANLLQFQGVNIVGFATADLVQAYPLLSTVWYATLFGEFRKAGGTVVLYPVPMYRIYVSCISFLFVKCDTVVTTSYGTLLYDTVI